MKKVISIFFMLSFFVVPIYASEQKCEIVNGKGEIISACDISDDAFSKLKDGFYKMNLYISDEAGNKSTISSEEFIVDHTAPKIGYKLSDETIIIYAKDNIDGNPKLSYIYQNNKFTVSKIKLDKTVDMSEIIEVTASDSAHNVSNKNILIEIKKGRIFAQEISLKEKSAIEKKIRNSNASWVNFLSNHSNNEYSNSFEITNNMILNILITVILLLPLVILYLIFKRTGKMINDITRILK